MGYNSMTTVTDLWGHMPQGRSFAFPNAKGLHVSLAKKDPSEVGPLSRQVMAPYPSRYRKALAFSDILCPLAYRPALRQAFPERNLRDAIGFTVFRIDDTDGEDAVFRPEA